MSVLLLFFYFAGKWWKVLISALTRIAATGIHSTEKHYSLIDIFENE